MGLFFFYHLLLFKLNLVHAQAPLRLVPGEDLSEVLHLMGKGSYQQFSTPPTLGITALGITTTTVVWNSDQRLLEKESNPRGLERLIGYDISNALNFGVVSFISYGLAGELQDSKLKQFALENFAANNMVLFESLVMSYVPTHPRPQETNLSKWETFFRDDYSLPSGHAAAFATLTFKTWQFYGPFWASFPLLGYYFCYRQRVGSHQHYPSDMVATLFLGALASEGTRLAARDSFMDPSYRPLFDHQFSWQVIPLGRAGFYAGVARAF